LSDPEQTAIVVETLDDDRRGARRRKQRAMTLCVLGPVGCWVIAAIAYSAGLRPWIVVVPTLIGVAAFPIALSATIAFAFLETRASSTLRKMFRDGQLENLPDVPVVQGMRLGAQTVLRSGPDGIEVGLRATGSAVFLTQLVAVVGGALLVLFWCLSLWQNGLGVGPSISAQGLLIFWGAPFLAIALVVWGLFATTVRWAAGPTVGGFVLEKRSLLGGRKVVLVSTTDIERLLLALPKLRLETVEGARHLLVEFDRIDRSHGVVDVAAEGTNDLINRWRAQRLALVIEGLLGLESASDDSSGDTIDDTEESEK